jgi:hypothetical protein
LNLFSNHFNGEGVRGRKKIGLKGRRFVDLWKRGGWELGTREFLT